MRQPDKEVFRNVDFVRYLVGHENSKVTMDIYAKVKFNKPWELASVVNQAFEPHDNGEKSTNLMG